MVIVFLWVGLLQSCIQVHSPPAFTSGKMGNKTSALEFEGFEKNEISRLSKRFKKLDTDRWDPANLKVLKALLS